MNSEPCSLAPPPDLTPTFEEKASDCWITPPEVFDLYDQAWDGGHDFDPFFDPETPIRSARTLDVRSGCDAFRDALEVVRDEVAMNLRCRVHVNAPYSAGHPPRTAELCHRMRIAGAEVANLCIAEPGLDYWDQWIFPTATAVVWLGRLPFVAGRDMYDKAGKLTYRKGQRAKNNRYSVALVLHVDDPHPWKHRARKIFDKPTSLLR